MTRAEIEALPASTQTDALVAERIMGWRKMGPADRSQGFDNFAWNNDKGSVGWYIVDDPDYYACGNQCRVWAPSADIASASLVLDEMHRRGYAWALKRYRPGVADDGASHRVSFYNERETHDGYASALPLAIVRAALIAVTEE